MPLTEGLYDLLLTEQLARSLAALDAGRADVHLLKGGAGNLLADLLTRQLGAILEDVAGEGAEKAGQQLELVNALLVMLRQRLGSGDIPGTAMTAADAIDLVAPPLRVLKAVRRDQQFPASPEIGLTAPWLFTAGKGSPSLLPDHSSRWTRVTFFATLAACMWRSASSPTRFWSASGRRCATRLT